MSRAAMLLRTDVLRVVRDPMLVVLSMLPLAVAAAVRFGMSATVGRLAAADDAAAATVAAAVLLLLTPMMFGFVLGLMLLDERDEGVLTAVAVTPVGKIGFLGYRMAAPVLWSAVAAVLVVVVAGVGSFAPARLAAVAVLAGLEAPLLALFLGAFSADKVRGMALGKVGTVLIALTALAVLAPEPWRWLAAPSPHYWLVWLTAAREVPGSRFLAGVAVALATHGAALWLLARAFHRRIG